MKIALISQPLDLVAPPFQTSIGMWNYEVGMRLAKHFDVRIYARRPGIWKSPISMRTNILHMVPSVHYRVLLKLFDIFGRIQPKDRPFFSSNLFCVDYAVQIALSLRKWGCEVANIHNFSQLIPIIKAYNPHVKIILHMHCEWLSQLNQKMIADRLESVDRIAGCSEFITERIRNRFPKIAGRCSTIATGVDPSYFTADHNGRQKNRGNAGRLLFAGRISPEKGVHTLLEAFRMVLKEDPKAQLDVVGPTQIAPKEFIVSLDEQDLVRSLAVFYKKNYMSYLQHLIKGIDRQVTFIGFVPHRAMTEYFKKAEIFIHPSIWNEPFGIPIIEAMASEVPVVATRTGGVPEIIEHGQEGLLVEPSNPAALAEAILCLLKDGDLRRAMGKRGRQKVLDRFSWDRVLDKLVPLQKFLHYA